MMHAARVRSLICEFEDDRGPEEETDDDADDDAGADSSEDSSEAEQARMILVATNGGGSHWHADDQASLLQVFEDVANNLPTLITE